MLLVLVMAFGLVACGSSNDGAATIEQVEQKPEESAAADDAAAEAEYNAQMNKINRKEKILDMQAKRLDTEYSALTNEYNSIKTIIDNHTQKDFSYFS